MYRIALSAFAVSALLIGCTEYDLVHGDDLVPAPQPGFPVAVCDASPNPVTPPFEAATFDGSGSYDPDDIAIVSYVWELVSSPPGSTLPMPAGPITSPIRSGFVPELAGDYVARLTVTNERGNENSCEITLNAVPTQDLWVEMFWQYSGDDMDLHVLAPGGVLETDSDCYYANCVDYGWGSLDWGQSGYAGDDPRLDLDDISGTGPENINIGEPATGVYTVVVHDYPGSQYAGGNNVTVNIYLGGALEFSDTRTISGEDTYTYFARIDWATKTVQGL